MLEGMVHYLGRYGYLMKRVAVGMFFCGYFIGNRYASDSVMFWLVDALKYSEAELPNMLFNPKL